MPHTTDSKLTENKHVYTPKLSSKVEQAAGSFGAKSFRYANRRPWDGLNAEGAVRAKAARSYKGPLDQKHVLLKPCEYICKES